MVPERHRCGTGAVVTRVARRTDDVTLTLTDGENLRADRCVVTVPIGVLKAGKITFEPALLSRKREAIEALGSGLLDKLWLQFPSVFWDKKADLIEWSDPTDPGRWSLWVNGHQAFGKPVLLGFNAGSPAHDHAHLTDRQVLDSAMDALRRMHSDTAPAAPGPRRGAPAPDGCHVFQRTHGTKHFHHPVVGDLVLGYEAFTAADDPEQTLCVSTTEPGSLSAERLKRLASWARSPQRPESAARPDAPRP
ncbi:FAD-dependent oxidoreductase [Streptomyces sp. NPDC056652]|uniref:FAD-dependent oxidoreductase n=1 Tax=Streptomyces sp. NPDC056652 TaxID=3345893 RepID=UPI0036B7054F